MADRRRGQCVVHTDKGNLVINYIVRWRDRDKAVFEVLIPPPDLPSCTDPKVVQLLERTLRATPIGPKIRSVDGHRQVRYDEATDSRRGQCVVHTENGEAVVNYMVRWRDRDKRRFEVGIVPAEKAENQAEKAENQGEIQRGKDGLPLERPDVSPALSPFPIERQEIMENHWLLGVSDWIWPSLGLLSIPVLVAINGLFVAAEFALVAVRRTRIEEMVHHGQAGAKAVESAVINLDRSIAATQLGITLASIALGWSGEPAMAHFSEPVFDFLPIESRGIASHSVASAIAFLIDHVHARRLRRVDSQDDGAAEAGRDGALGGDAR